MKKKNKKIFGIILGIILIAVGFLNLGNNIVSQGLYNKIFSISNKDNLLVASNIEYSCTSWSVGGWSSWKAGAPSSGSSTSAPSSSCTSVTRYIQVKVETSTACITNYGLSSVPCYQERVYTRDRYISSCGSGYYLENNSCIECEIGNYCNGTEKKACTDANEYQDEKGQSTCKTIPSNSTVSSDHTSYTCNNGYQNINGVCVLKPTIVCPSSLYVGSTGTCTVNNGNLTSGVTSSDSNIATVTGSGSTSISIKGQNAGTVSFTATINGQKITSNTVTIKEVPIPVSSVSISCNSNNVFVGDKVTCTATVLPSNATSKDITWSVNDTSFAGIDQSGHVTARKKGSVTVIAKSAVDSSKSSMFTISINENPVLETIEGNNIIAIAEDIGTVIGNYSSKDQNKEYIKVDWGANGSGAIVTDCSNKTSCRVSFTHQGVNGTNPKITTSTITALNGNTTKTYDVKVYSYCAWNLVDSNKGPYSNSQYLEITGISGTRDAMKYKTGCEAYDGWNLRSDGWYYTSHYNRCCGSGSTIEPEKSACYVKRGSGVPNTYCYGTSTTCAGYNEKIDNITSSSSCNEASSCYKDSNGNYVIGKYSGQSGYTLVGDTCPSTPKSFCYANASNINDATSVIWTTQSSAQHPYLISGVSKDNCKASACYVNNDKTDYKWATSAPNGYTKVNDILSSSLCKPEESACYQDSKGNYVWGKYASFDGYTKISSIKDENTCVTPTPTMACYQNGFDYIWTSTKPSGYTKVENVTTPDTCKKEELPACYIHDNKYVWGKYENISNYKLVPTINNANDCVNSIILDVPKTSSNVEIIIYILVTIFGITGAGIVIWTKNKK